MRGCEPRSTAAAHPNTSSGVLKGRPAFSAKTLPFSHTPLGHRRTQHHVCMPQRCWKVLTEDDTFCRQAVSCKSSGVRTCRSLQNRACAPQHPQRRSSRTALRAHGLSAPKRERSSCLGALTGCLSGLLPAQKHEIVSRAGRALGSTPPFRCSTKNVHMPGLGLRKSSSCVAMSTVMSGIPFSPICSPCSPSDFSSRSMRSAPGGSIISITSLQGPARI